MVPPSQLSILLGLLTFNPYTLANPLNLVLRATCNADNCARAVTGTSPNTPPLTSRKADCSRFQGTSTVTPKAVTVIQTATATPPAQTTTVLSTGTIAATVFSTSTTTSVVVTSVPVTSTEVDTTTTTATVTNFVKRENDLQIRDGTVPAYASPCSGAVRYSSACSCFGITRGTVTASTPTITSTITRTLSPSTTTVTSEVDVTSTTTLPTVATASSTQSTTFTAATVTTVTTQTVTTQESCPTSNVVVNGGFESGSIAPFNFQSNPTIFGTSGGSISVVNQPSLAGSGSYFASVNAAIEFAGVSFSLTQSLSNLCPSVAYTLSFKTISQCPSAGACSCSLQACVNNSCINFDPAGGESPQQVFMNTFVQQGTTAQLQISTDFCERRFVRFDDFSVKVATL